MRKKLLAVSLLVILLSLAAYGTYAYLTEEARTTNVITTGTVEISLVEKTKDANGEWMDFPTTAISGVVPGKSVDKLVTVDNEGTGDAWIRASVTCKIVAADKETELPLVLANGESALSFDINEEMWKAGEGKRAGYYYYTAPVDPADSTEQLFSKVTFNPAMGNEYQECTVYVDVVAEAIQVKNNGDAEGETYLDAYWPDGPVPPAPEKPVTPDDSADDNTSDDSVESDGTTDSGTPDSGENEAGTGEAET